MPSGLVYLKSLTSPFPIKKSVWLTFIITIFLEISVFNANRVDPDQTPRSAASDLDLSVCQCPFYGMLGIHGLRSSTALASMYCYQNPSCLLTEYFFL